MTPTNHPSNAEKLNGPTLPAQLRSDDILLQCSKILSRKLLSRFKFIIFLLLHKHKFISYYKKYIIHNYNSLNLSSNISLQHKRWQQKRKKQTIEICDLNTFQMKLETTQTHP